MLDILERHKSQTYRCAINRYKCAINRSHCKGMAPMQECSGASCGCFLALGLDSYQSIRSRQGDFPELSTFSLILTTQMLPPKSCYVYGGCHQDQSLYKHKQILHVSFVQDLPLTQIKQKTSEERWKGLSGFTSWFCSGTFTLHYVWQWQIRYSGQREQKGLRVSLNARQLETFHMNAYSGLRIILALLNTCILWGRCNVRWRAIHAPVKNATRICCSGPHTLSKIFSASSNLHDKSREN